jgi:hypothetical protein
MRYRGGLLRTSSIAEENFLTRPGEISCCNITLLHGVKQLTNAPCLVLEKATDTTVLYRSTSQVLPEQTPTGQRYKKLVLARLIYGIMITNLDRISRNVRFTYIRSRKLYIYIYIYIYI